MNNVATPQHHSHAVQPALAKKKRIELSNAPPITTVSVNALNRSAQNVAIVIRLKPNCSSITNVEYRRNGSPPNTEAAINPPMNSSPDPICPHPWARTMPSNQPNPPNCQKASNTASLTAPCPSPKRVRTRVYSCDFA